MFQIDLYQDEQISDRVLKKNKGSFKNYFPHEIDIME